jgi:hypothetical protein
MESYSFTTIIEEPPPDMQWLVGRKIVNAEKVDFSWFFSRDDGSSIATESPWRLITAVGIAVTSEDDGHPFGLGTPVSAADRVMSAVAGQASCGFEVRKGSGDLVVRFPGDVWIEFLNMSCGYDGWRTVHGQQELVCLGGGRLAAGGVPPRIGFVRSNDIWEW